MAQAGDGVNEIGVVAGEGSGDNPQRPLAKRVGGIIPADPVLVAIHLQRILRAIWIVLERRRRGRIEDLRFEI